MRLFRFNLLLENGSKIKMGVYAMTLQSAEKKMGTIVNCKAYDFEGLTYVAD